MIKRLFLKILKKFKMNPNENNEITKPVILDVENKQNNVSFACIVNDTLKISISVQSGCVIGCKYCKFGNTFYRNLTLDEMKQQLNAVLDSVKNTNEKYSKVEVDNLCSGEPMMNWVEVERFIEYCRSLNFAFNLYTVGVEYPDILSRILNMSIKYKDFNLFFNITSMNDKDRNDMFKNHGILYLRLQKIVNYCNKYKLNSGKKVNILYHYTGFESISDVEIIKTKFTTCNFIIKSIIKTDETDKNIDLFKQKIDSYVQVNIPTVEDYYIDDAMYKK